MTRWLHGGMPGQRVGQWLLPPSVTGHVSGARYALQAGIDVRAEGLSDDLHRDDCVYLTSEIGHARSKAGAVLLTGRARFGSVYEAVPAGPQPDPDFEPDFPGLSVQCPFALITAVVQPVVVITPDQLERFTLRYMTFVKGTCPQCGHTDLPVAGCQCEICPCWPARLGVRWRWSVIDGGIAR